MTDYVTETTKITNQFKCPKCGHIAEYSGRPNERVIVTCASCGIRGTITLPETVVPLLNLLMETRLKSPI